MASDGSHAWEKLYLANGILAAGHAPLRERLARAVPHLTMLEPHRDFPWPELRRRFEEVMSEFTAPECQLDAALAKRSDIDLTRIVHEITDIYDGVARKVGIGDARSTTRVLPPSPKIVAAHHRGAPSRVAQNGGSGEGMELDTNRRAGRFSEGVGGSGEVRRR